MIGPVVEEVGLRRMPVAVAVASLTAVAGLLAVTTAAAGGGGGDTGSDHVMVNGGEPQNQLIPTNTNETNVAGYVRSLSTKEVVAMLKPNLERHRRAHHISEP